VTAVGHRRILLDATAALRAETFGDTTEHSVEPDRSGGKAPEAERRQLTIMFADLVGSTALSARLDPEELRDIIGAYHRRCAEVITGSGGFVAKYLGDGVLAYFGYPQAHEEDAEQAVRAGLALVEAVAKLDMGQATSLQVRVGIATGLVVVGDLLGEGVAKEQAVIGETPNLAARLQGLAEPNTVVIADSTRRMLGGLFDYHDQLDGSHHARVARSAHRPSRDAAGPDDSHISAGVRAALGRPSACDFAQSQPLATSAPRRDDRARNPGQDIAHGDRRSDH
jgi:class 3 adenylate cyclase